jgi:hypothetical protein
MVEAEIQSHPPIASSLCGAMPACVIDQNSAHHLSRDGAEMWPVLPARVALVDELEIRFVYERGRFERMARPLALQIRSGERTELAVHHRHEFVGGVTISVTQTEKTLRCMMCGLILHDGSASAHEAATPGAERKNLLDAV